MNSIHSLVTVCALLACGTSAATPRGERTASAGGAQSAAARETKSQTPTYRNAQIISIDSANRMLVIKGPDGKEETVPFDANLAGLADLKAGDHVTLTLRGSPGLVSAITASQPPAARPSPAASPSPGTLPAQPALDVTRAARDAFAGQVAALAEQASQVDRVWAQFRSTCGATVNRRYEGAREWFGLWDKEVRADLSISPCRDLFNQVVNLGQGVLTGMAAAEEEARKAALLPGDIRKVTRGHSMDWDGWDRTAPDRLAR